VKARDLTVRAATDDDRELLRTFRCSDGQPWEDHVEDQVRGPLAGRYLASPPMFDGRLLLGLNGKGALLAVGAHRIEPAFAQDVGYTEVIAVACQARGTLVRMASGDEISLGHFMLMTILRQMASLGRHPRTFVRVDRRNIRSLAMLDRVGLSEERADFDEALVQRWGLLPAALTFRRPSR
jgi:hypothetical protein